MTSSETTKQTGQGKDGGREETGSGTKRYLFWLFIMAQSVFFLCHFLQKCTNFKASLTCFGTSEARERADIRTLLFLLNNKQSNARVTLMNANEWKHFSVTREELVKQTTCLSNTQNTYCIWKHTPLVWRSLGSVFPDIVHELPLSPSTGRKSF